MRNQPKRPLENAGHDDAAAASPARAAPRRAVLLDFLRPGRGQFVVGTALFLTALLVVLTLRSQARQPEFANARQDDLIQLLDNVTGETRRLEGQVRELERARSELQSGADRNRAARQEAERRLEQAQILAGTVPVNGPGIRIRIEDPAGKVTPDLLLDAVEELRDAGAEVMEINDSVRIVMNSWFGRDPSGRVTAQGRSLSAPYIIDVIGDAATLEAGARFRGGLVSEVEGERVGGKVTITQLPDLHISATIVPETKQYARPR